MSIIEDFYAILRKACEKRGNQQELANASGIGQPVLNRILSGKTKDPGLHSVSAILDALGYSLCRGSHGGNNFALQAALVDAEEKIKKLENELAHAHGEINGLQAALDKVLDKSLSPSEKESHPPIKIDHVEFPVNSDGYSKKL